jgi:hypothetical protein
LRPGLAVQADGIQGSTRTADGDVHRPLAVTLAVLCVLCVLFVMCVCVCVCVFVCVRACYMSVRVRLYV